MNLTETAEVIKVDETSNEERWEKSVRERCKDLCINCGSTDRLKVRMIVPEKAGGQKVPSNGAVMCRTCEMSSDSYSKSSQEEQRRLVNFWVSTELFSRLEKQLTTQKGFNSMGGVVRYLISKYIEDDARFDDLELYQDEGADTKINVWVDRDKYNVFKTLLDKNGLTITSAIKSLIGMYLEMGSSLGNAEIPQGNA